MNRYLELMDTGLRLRLMSALVLAPIVLIIVRMGGIPFYLLAMAALVLGLREWIGLCKDFKPHREYLIGGSAYIALGVGSFIFLQEMAPANAIYLILTIWAS